MKPNGNHDAPKKSLGELFADFLKEDDEFFDASNPPVVSQPAAVPKEKPWVVNPVRTFAGHTSPVWSVAVWGESVLSSGGWRGAKATHDCTVRLWNMQTGSEMLSLQGH